jgi:hypothetical protein
MTTLAQLEEGIRLTKIATERAVAGAALHIPAAVDVLIQLPRFARAERSVQGEQPFRFWAVSAYVNAAHTSWALYDLWRSGLYYESTILLRNLTESLVQLRYFETHMADVLQLLDEKTVRKFKFKTMFEAVAPGYYDKWYGLMSSVAHGRMGATVFRIDDTRIAMGAGYNESLASFVMNQFDPILLGLLRHFPRHFPGYASAVDSGLEARRVAEVAWLQSAFDAQVAQFPRSMGWAGLFRPLVEVEETPASTLS